MGEWRLVICREEPDTAGPHPVHGMPHDHSLTDWERAEQTRHMPNDSALTPPPICNNNITTPLSSLGAPLGIHRSPQRLLTDSLRPHPPLSQPSPRSLFRLTLPTSFGNLRPASPRCTMSKGMLSAAARVWSRAAALQAEEAVMMASPSLRPQIYEDPVVYRPPPAVPRRAFPPPYPPPRAPPSTSRPPTGPAHEHQDIKEQDEMWSDPRRHVEVEVFDEPAQPVKAQPQVEKKPAQVERPAAVSATVAALQKQADKLESQYTAKPSPRPVPVAPAVKTAAAPTPTPKPAVAAATPEVKKPFVVDPSVDPMTYLPQVEADPEDVSCVARRDN